MQLASRDGQRNNSFSAVITPPPPERITNLTKLTEQPVTLIARFAVPVRETAPRRTMRMHSYRFGDREYRDLNKPRGR